MFKIAVIAFALVAAVSARTSPCSEGASAMPLAVRINTCPDNNAICRIIRGTAIEGQMDFVSPFGATALRPHITAHAIGTTVIYELPADRAIGCDWIMGTSCPLSEDEFATYSLNMPITDQYPLIPLIIEVRLFDQSDNLQFCVSIESEVVAN